MPWLGLTLVAARWGAATALIRPAAYYRWRSRAGGRTGPTRVLCLGGTGAGQSDHWVRVERRGTAGLGGWIQPMPQVRPSTEKRPCQRRWQGREASLECRPTKRLPPLLVPGLTRCRKPEGQQRDGRQMSDEQRVDVGPVWQKLHDAMNGPGLSSYPLRTRIMAITAPA